MPPADQTASVSVERSVPIILLVEDEHLVRWQIGDEFYNAGWHVLQASTGEQALSFLHASQDIDLLITDIQLGGVLNGWDIAEAFRATRPDLPVIYASSNPVVASRIVPASVFLTKPFGMNELMETCRELVEQ
jgi:DNA-binding response OmpR family regulator